MEPFCSVLDVSLPDAFCTCFPLSFTFAEGLGACRTSTGILKDFLYFIRFKQL